MVGLRDMARSDAERKPPTWLRNLLETSFFEECPKHPASESGANRRTAGCNFFCTRCPSHALCSDCLSTHEGHELIQIRRLSGHNAVKVDDIQRLLSVSLVQTYVCNEHLAVFLNRRPMSGQGSHSTTHCEECNRGLQDEACRFCSLGCKADGVEDDLDFSVSFAIDANNNDNSRVENEANENEANENEANDNENEDPSSLSDDDEAGDPSYSPSEF